ncbi:uncharacterized protein EDB91DRAFT_1249953 [Suillus paluster]|uniref:uncharacterized protein n=1 Tax=Suillus paluster TaxID=48578 RepID=UPI001B87FE55|nr:uncharacterized protein EDB91DRAFT_1249953 [Suillus paluster]KAG1736652.1 hypothetical protein EDB91DRAFT_1249953 [Suillus paluster]
MPSDTPDTNLWLERSRLDGMLLGGVSYGVFFLLTVQAATALVQRPRYGGKIAHNRRALLVYIVITFVLGTIDVATNMRYTEMIWIDLRDAPGGPLALIENAMNYRINIVTLSTYYIMAWFMQALLLHRCSVIWDRARPVMIPMITLYLAMFALSILILIQASTGTVFFKINTKLLYLCMEVGFTMIYTILVTNRLLIMRGQMKQLMAHYDSSTYDTVILMLIESAMLYTTFCIILIVSSALHSEGVFNLFFLSVNNVQGIAQLLIITRVARGRAITREWSIRSATARTSIAFTWSVSDTTDGTNFGRIARPEQDSIQLSSVNSAKAESEAEG